MASCALNQGYGIFYVPAAYELWAVLYTIQFHIGAHKLPPKLTLTIANLHPIRGGLSWKLVEYSHRLINAYACNGDPQADSVGGHVGWWVWMEWRCGVVHRVCCTY